MSTTIDTIIQAGLADKVLTEHDMHVLFSKSNNARYSLINKALKAKELIKLRRSLYVLPEQFRTTKVSLFHLANKIIPFSYVSLETALSFHGWIPEGVKEITSVVTRGRQKTFTNAFGEFSYQKVLVKNLCHLIGVESHLLGINACLIASPLRALCDLISIKKWESVTIDFLIHSLRIEPETIDQINTAEIAALQSVYQHRYAKRFLDRLR